MAYTYTLRLWFRANKGGPPGPVARIALKTWSGSDVDDGIYLSSNCISFVELDSEVTRLKRELDQIRADARRRFEADQKAMLADSDAELPPPQT
jgi:hypothetical protein